MVEKNTSTGKKAREAGTTTDTLDKWIYDRVKRGMTINDLYDPNEKRLWKEPKPGGGTGVGAGGSGGGGAGGAGGGYGAAHAMGSAGGDAGAGGATPPRRDPLVLDLDGDGIETTSTRDGTVILFDHDADGVKTGTGWIKPDHGWLVLDRNGNGTIDSGRSRRLTNEPATKLATRWLPEPPPHSSFP